MLFIMVSGGIYFGDFEKFSKLEAAMFGTGVFIMLLGIFCLIPSDTIIGAYRTSKPLIIWAESYLNMLGVQRADGTSAAPHGRSCHAHMQRRLR